jgi:hypothetical protein
MLANWTKATTTTNTSGTITLTAVTGYPLPSKSCVTGEYVQYSIHTSDAKFEAGVGKIAASDTLERTKIFSTYDGTTYNSTTATALTLATGTHDVFITPLAEATFEGLRFQLTGPTNACVIPTNYTPSSTTNFVPTLNHTHAFPMRIETPIVVASLGSWIATTGASSEFLLGIYEAGANGRPERLLCKTSATMSGTTTGLKSQAVNTAVALKPGWYWGALVVTAGTVPQIYGRYVGATAMGGANGYHYFSGMKSAASPGTDLTDPFPTTSLTYYGGGDLLTMPIFDIFS